MSLGGWRDPSSRSPMANKYSHCHWGIRTARLSGRAHRFLWLKGKRLTNYMVDKEARLELWYAPPVVMPLHCERQATTPTTRRSTMNPAPKGDPTGKCTLNGWGQTEADFA